MNRGMLADTILDNAALKDLLGKSRDARCATEAARYLRQAYQISERRACRVIGTDRTKVRYQGVRPADDALRERLKALADGRRRSGYRASLCCCGAKVMRSTRSGFSASTERSG